MLQHFGVSANGPTNHCDNVGWSGWSAATTNSPSCLLKHGYGITNNWVNVPSIIPKDTCNTAATEAVMYAEMNHVPI